MTMGVAISVKSDLGVSPVSSIPYTMTCIWGIEMGRATILFHTALVVLQVLLLRKDFKIIDLLQILVGVLFGTFTTFSNSLMVFFPDPSSIVIRIIMVLFSTVIIAFGLFMYVPADFIPLAGEGVMLAIAKVTNIKFSTVKIMFDVTMVAVSFVTCMIVIGEMGSVGIGTIMAAILVGVELKIITRLFGEARDRLLSRGEATGACINEVLD